MAPNAEQKQTSGRATAKWNRKPLRMDRNSDPGMANACKLEIKKIIIIIKSIVVVDDKQK